MDRDSVDTSLEEWSRQQPDLNVAGRHVLWRIALLNRHVEQRISSMVNEFGLGDSSFKLLLRLLRAGPPYAASPSDLSKESLYSSGAMTNLIARVESLGLVERSPDPDDRRGVRVSLTPAGLERITAAHAAYLALERELLQMFTAEERDQLTALLRKMLIGLEGSGKDTSS